MRSYIRIHSIPLWPLMKNVFLIAFIVLILLSLIFGFLWMGMLRQITMEYGNSGMPFDSGMFENIGGMVIVMMSLINGVFGSVMTAIFFGIAGLIYNLVNGDRGGIELEVSLTESDIRQTAAEVIQETKHESAMGEGEQHEHD